MTSTPTISIENLSNLIDQSISDLRNGNSNRVFDLARVLDSIAECNDKPYLFIFPQCIGGISSELMRSNSMITIPVLPQKVRDSHGKLVAVATEQAIKALEIIKSQLCNENSTDYEKLMESAGILFQQAGILSAERRQFSRNTQPPNEN